MHATKAPICSKIRIESRLIRTLSRRRSSEAIFVVVRSDPFRADVRASARVRSGARRDACRRCDLRTLVHSRFFAVKIFLRSAQGILFNESFVRINLLTDESVFLC